MLRPEPGFAAELERLLPFDPLLRAVLPCGRAGVDRGAVRPVERLPRAVLRDGPAGAVRGAVRADGRVLRDPLRAFARGERSRAPEYVGLPRESPGRARSADQRPELEPALGDLPLDRGDAAPLRDRPRAVSVIEAPFEEREG